jgi:hypothetical protein
MVGRGTTQPQVLEQVIEGTLERGSLCGREPLGVTEERPGGAE